MWLAAGQTQSAIVTAYIPPNAQIGDKDKITFTSQGIGLASQAATLTVTSSTALQVNLQFTQNSLLNVVILITIGYSSTNDVVGFRQSM